MSERLFPELNVEQKKYKMITVIILTYNENLHLERCIQSVKQITNKILVVDSFSTDSTLEIAKKSGAIVYQNTFINNAQQFQWALDHCTFETEWIMKMDADEIILPELAYEINEKLQNCSDDIGGFQVKCRVFFMGKWIKRGYYPMVLNRIFRVSSGYMEQKWMDEHIQLTKGRWELLQNDIVDENLNNLVWWTTKHNNYSTREAIVRLDNKHNFLRGNHSDFKNKASKQFYLKLPLFLRALLYYLYRYILKLGFLDGIQGMVWHFLQGFWYQMLIDAKIYQIEYIAKKNNISITSVIEKEFGIKINS